MSKRIVLIIMDSVGVGYGKDADEFGDMGSNTLGSIIRENPRLKIDNLKSMGILNLEKILPIAQQAKIKMGRCRNCPKEKIPRRGIWK